MNRQRMMLTMVLLAGMAFGVTTMAAEPIGLVISVEGSVQALSAAGTSRSLKLQSPIFSNDRIITGAGAKIQIMFDDDSVISQGELSEMIIDEYIYRPAGKQESKAFFKMIKGVFRAVTGKIVDLNQDGFKVETGKAIIGIRGCYLLFQIGKLDEDIYIIEVSPGRKIVIETSYLPEGSFSGEEVLQALEIVEPGTVIHIVEDGRMTEELFTLEDVRGVIQQVDSSAGSADEGDGSGQSGLRTEREQTDNPLARTGEDSDVVPPAFYVTPVPTAAPTPVPPDEPPQPSPGPDPTAVPTTGPTPVPPTPVPPTPVPTSQPTPEPTPEPTPVPTPVLHKEIVSSGEDWQWGVWKDDQGKVVDTFSQGAFLSPAEVQALIAGTMAYNLQGSGTAGAVIKHNGQNNMIDGTCDINVLMGGGNPAAWSGYFSLNDGASGGDYLLFRVENGTFRDGAMAGAAAYDYYLRSQGQDFYVGSLIQNEVDGHLVGPGLHGPVSGAAGDFKFEHDGREGPAVKGSYGTDLQDY